jgi:Type I restriction modification DNA specificity domain
VGRCAIWTGQLQPCGFQKALHRFRPRSEKECVRYMFYTLAHVASTGYFAASGSPNTILHLTAEKLRVFRFPKPPLEEQVQIAEHLDAERSRLLSQEAAVREAVNKLREYAPTASNARRPAGRSSRIIPLGRMSPPLEEHRISLSIKYGMDWELGASGSRNSVKRLAIFLLVAKEPPPRAFDPRPALSRLRLF